MVHLNPPHIKTYIGIGVKKKNCLLFENWRLLYRMYVKIRCTIKTSEEGFNASFHHVSFMPHILYFLVESPNSRSEPLNMISMLKYAWRPNFIFFGNFSLFFKIGTKSLFLDCLETVILDFENEMRHGWNEALNPQ